MIRFNQELALLDLSFFFNSIINCNGGAGFDKGLSDLYAISIHILCILI